MTGSDQAPRTDGWAPQTLTASAWAAGLFAIFAAWMISEVSGSRAVEVVGSLSSVVVTTAAVITTGLAARASGGRVRTAWTVLTLGLVAATIAEVIWARGHIVQRPPHFPSAADAAYLLFPVAMLVALLLFPSGRRPRYRGRLALDGVIMGGSVLIVSWLTVMSKAYASGAESATALMTALAYPASNVITVTVAAVVLARAGAGARPMLTLLTSGLLAMAVAESVFAYLSVDGGPLRGRHLIEVGWTAGIVLIALAGVQGRHTVFEEPSDPPPGWASVWLPYAPLMLATVAMGVKPGNVLEDGVILSCLVVLVPAVLARQFLAVAEHKRLLNAVVERATHDPLTGLANRSLFDERLAEALRSPTPDGDQSVAVVVLDLDGFKMINDNLGHTFGDALLVAVAERLRQQAGDGHTVARLGGDEFAILLEATPEEANRVAARLPAAFEMPFLIDGHRVVIGSGVGLAVCRPGETTAEALLKRADLSMYAAKRIRPGRPSPSGDDAAALAELRTAVADGALTVVYQPKVELTSGAVVGVEALLRWPHPDKGVLLPGQFLPLVRDQGLMEAINDLVLRMALDDARRWREQGADATVAVNIFAPTLADRALPTQIATALQQRDLPPEVLTLELTEDLPLGRIGPTKIVLSELRERGVRIAIDDFGAGYSALSYLMHLPLDEVKLDRSFVGPSLSGERVASVVRMTVGLARELGLTTVAEGVVDRETLGLLSGLGVDVAQGDLLGTPVPADEVPDLFAAGASAAPGVTTTGKP